MIKYIVFVAVIIATPVAAQTWVDPAGHFVLNYGPVWRQVTPSTANPEVLAAFASAGPSGARLCNVRRQTFPAPTQMDQAAANRWLEVFTVGPQGTASSRTVDEVDGVAFVNYGLSAGQLAGRYRAFALPAGAGIIRTEFMCASPSPLSAQDEAAIDAFFLSLQLTLNNEQ